MLFLSRPRAETCPVNLARYRIQKSSNQRLLDHFMGKNRAEGRCESLPTDDQVTDLPFISATYSI